MPSRQLSAPSTIRDAARRRTATANAATAKAVTAEKQNEYPRELRAMLGDWMSAWGDALRPKGLTQDILAGFTVAAVALPLNLALGVASGLPPSAGLVAGAIGGMIAAIFGGAPLSVTGPAAALNVLVLAVVADFGAPGAAAAAIVVGVAEVAMAFALAGKLAKFVPESVLAGFTTGVGLKLLDNQLPELLGFNYKVYELVQMMHRPAWLHHVSWLAVVSGLFVMFLVVTAREFKRFPAALVGIALVTALSVYLHWDIERVGDVPSSVPMPRLPAIPDERWLDLGIRTLPLALLAAVESLLSARGLDRMVAGIRPHNPNLELFGQGLANIGAGFFGSMPVTGVIVRSGVNVQSGGRTRRSSLIHAASLLMAMMFLSRSIALIPLAGLAGLLCVVGMRLIEVKTLVHMAKTEKIEAAAFAITCIGTVTGHLMMGLVVGLMTHAVNHYLHRGRREIHLESAEQRERGIRAVLTREDGVARRPAHYQPGPHSENWLSNIRQRAHVAASAFVHGQATVIGRVVLGEHVHIAAGSSVRADEGSPFFIGSNTNIQDGVVIHALKEKRVVVAGEEWAVYVGQNVSIAHNALVHGPCYIGDDTFVGFKAVVHDAVVGSHCFIGIGAVVVGVEIPDGKYVAHGSIVGSADQVDALPDVTDAHAEFNEDVVEVNRGLAAAYHQDGKISARPKVRAAERTERPRSFEAEWDRSIDRQRF